MDFYIVKFNFVPTLKEPAVWFRNPQYGLVYLVYVVLNGGYFQLIWSAVIIVKRRCIGKVISEIICFTSNSVTKKLGK